MVKSNIGVLDALIQIRNRARSGVEQASDPFVRSRLCVILAIAKDCLEDARGAAGGAQHDKRPEDRDGLVSPEISWH